jgi:GTP-binding protein
VGKSSLFNRILGRREAIVDDMPGVTRDRLYGAIELEGHNLYVVDTGGLVTKDEDPFTERIRIQVTRAIEESSAILFVIDGNDGPTPMDLDIADLLHKSGKPVIVAVNKIDDPKHEVRVADAYSMGFEHVEGVSALHKRGVDALLRSAVSLLPEELPPERQEGEIEVAIIGRPNVGKSSLFNRLAGEERSLVSPVAGTTRDAIDTHFTLDGVPLCLVDTAGMRKRSRIESDVEYYSLVRALESVGRCDVALLVMEGTEPCTDQDKKLAAHAVEKGKALVLLVNKWDTLDKENNLGAKMTKKIREEMPFVDWAPILFVSALHGRGLGKIGPAIQSAFNNRNRRIPTNVLNRLIRDVLAFDHLPTDGKGRTLKIG